MSLIAQELLLPITQTGHHFFQDSIFDQSRRHFDMAIREIIERRGLSTTDHMNSYRSLRQKELRDDNQAISITDEHQARKITLDVKDFKDGDLSVKAVGHSIVVEGRVERKEGSSVSSHSFRRRFSLPGVVDMSSVTSAISSDGILTITAPKTKKLESSLKLQMPISSASTVQESTVQKSTSTQQGTSLSDIESQIIGAEKTTATGQTEQTSTSTTKTEKTGRSVAIQPETPLPVMVRGSFFDDNFFSNVHRDFEDGIDKILRRYNIGSSSKESLTNYRTLRGGNLTDETQAVTLSEDDTCHKIVLDVQDFKDGDVQLKAVGNSLVVEGRVEKTVDGSKSTHTFRRRFALPSDTDLNDVTAAMSSDGILTILAKKDVKSLQSSGHFVPVQMQERSQLRSDVQDSSSQILSQQKQTTTSQTSQTAQTGTVPIEMEGTSVSQLREQQQQLMQQQKQIQEQLAKITQQQQYIKDQQQEIEKQKLACEKLQQEAQEKLRIASQLEATVKAQTEHKVPIVTEPESVTSTPVPDTAMQKSLHQQAVTQQTVQQQQSTTDVAGRVLPIRTESVDSSVSGISDVSSVLQHSEGNTQNVQQSTRSVLTQSDTNKSMDSSIAGDSKVIRKVESNVRDIVLPIERRGDFFQDSFFGNDHKIFNSAVTDVLDRFGMKSSTSDALSTYRTLRQSVSMEETQAAQISEEEKSYKVVLDVRDFVGGDVKVKADGQMLVVEGRAEKKEGNASSSQSFRRCFTFPTSVNIETVTSALSSDGVLTITAPKSDHFSIIEMDSSGQTGETRVSQLPQAMQGTTTSTSTSSRTKTATGWREESSFHESSVGDGVTRQVTSKTFQSSSTTGSSS